MLATVLFLLAAEAASPPAIPPPLSPPQKPKLICREDEQLVGTHIHGGRRCKTAEQWRSEDDHLDPNSSPSMRVTEGQGDALSNQRPPH